MTDKLVAVGRAATPPPPNVGSSTLGRILRLDTDPLITGRLHVVGLVAPDLFERLADQVGPVFPAVPGVAEEVLATVPVRCVVIDEDALKHGAWSGVLEGHTTELREELVRFLNMAAVKRCPMYWVRRKMPEDERGTAVVEDMGWTPEDPGLPDFPCPQAILIAPNSRMAEGVEEDARPSAVVAALRAVLD